MKLKFTILSCIISITANCFAGDKHFTVTSPDTHISVSIDAGKQLSYAVSYKGKIISGPNRLGMSLTNGTVLGENAVLTGAVPTEVNRDVRPLYGMAAVYHDNYHQLQLKFSDKFSVLFRVFDNGMAYRFITSIPGKIKVKDEMVDYAFDRDARASMMKVGGYLNSYEDHYVDDRISYLDSGKIAALPLLVKSKGVNIGITESDLLDYPGLYFTYGGNNTLKGMLPKFVLKDSIGGCCPNFERLPLERADYIAETPGVRAFPWRLMIIADEDKDLLYNNLVYLLASDNKIGDGSWIKPGKVAWDWWNANNLTGVPFKTGFNTETYKYYIDFAARNGIAYINMDEGWSDQYDLLKPNKKAEGLDMPYLFKYAKEKGVGIILWCVWHTLDRQMEPALDRFQQWGVKGIKVDFMDRDDQTVVNFYERLAKEAAKRHMLVNFHGAFKPTGLERTYPNVINREAVQGLEYNKFTNRATPDHAAHIPFIRMLAGPMDYTPGGMYNANQTDFRISNDRPMTQGTRCQQLAMYTLFYAPLEMLADAPTAYEHEPVILKYLAEVPTTWNETIPVDGKVGEYAVIARRKGSDWYIAGITNWTGRNFKLHLNFLPPGTYRADVFTDGMNANRVGNDYSHSEKQLSAGDALDITMANGGGFAIKLSKQ